MTTNVFDGAASVVATDSRWSWRRGPYLVYLDDTGFDKIQVLDDLIVMFAGRGDLIQAWRNFFAATPRILANQPAETKEVTLCMIDAKTGEFVKSAGGLHHIVENSRFAGTGGRYACSCWLLNRDAVKAVESAKEKDPMSGGEVRFVDIKRNTTNITPIAVQTQNITYVNAALDNRGLVMKITDNTILGTPVPFKVAAANDSELAAFGAQIASGQIPPSAPFEEMDREWTPAEKQDINNALSRFGWV